MHFRISYELFSHIDCSPEDFVKFPISFLTSSTSFEVGWKESDTNSISPDGPRDSNGSNSSSLFFPVQNDLNKI